MKAPKNQILTIAERTRRALRARRSLRLSPEELITLYENDALDGVFELEKKTEKDLILCKSSDGSPSNSEMTKRDKEPGALHGATSQELTEVMKSANPSGFGVVQ
jgi:hypothetical protein